MDTCTNLYDLIKVIKTDTLDDILNRYKNKPSKRGYLFEHICSILIKSGFCYGNKDYCHMDGNINLCNMNKIIDLEYYFKNTKVFSKNKGGSSDITFRKSDGTWVFISCKFYKNDKRKSIKDYDVQDILKEINEYRHIYEKYEIHLIVNNKKQVDKIIQSSQETNKTIVKNINSILGFKDVQKAFVKFQSDLQDVDLNMKNHFNNKFYNIKERLILRFHQDLITERTLDKINENNKSFLWGWKCRSGKSYGVGGLLIKYYKKFNRCNALIITPAPTETISQFVDDLFIKYRDFNDFNIIKVKNKKELLKLTDQIHSNNIIICSKQLLDNTKAHSIVDLNLDFIVFDENHFGGCSKLSKDTITTYSSTSTIKLFLTATFHKPLLEWNIPLDCQFYWNIEDEQICKKRDIDKLIEKHSDQVLEFIDDDILKAYDNMPNLELLTTIMDSDRYDKIRKDIKDTKFGFSMETLFSLTKHNKFMFEKEVENVLSYISGSFYGSVKDKKSIFERIKKISIDRNSRTTLCNQNFTTQLWFLPIGQGLKIDKVSKCLKKSMLNDSVLKSYDIMIINSHKEYKLKDLKGEIGKKELKAKNNGKIGLILLAGNQCSLGITLPLCDVVILLNNTLSMDRILQMMYRCMSEGDGKKCGFVVDLNISRILNTLTEYNINKKDLTVKSKLEYLIENNLINIDSDLFMNKCKGCKQSEKLITKLLNIWNSDPLNNHKLLMKRLERQVIEVDDNFQNIMNKCFTKSKNIKLTIKMKLDENNDQVMQSGKDITTNKKDELEKKIIKISLTKDVLPFVIPLSCILTLHNEQMDFIKMLENIKDDNNLLNIFNEQSLVWWNKKDVIDIIREIVTKYIKKDTESYKIAIQFKLSLKSLIDKPKELLELVDECLKPKKIEKKKYGEVFTPTNMINKMLDRLDEYHKKTNNGKSIFEEKNFTWFDPANGMGNFPIIVYYRLMEGLKDQIKDGKTRKKHILENMLYMSEFNRKNVYICKIIFDIRNKYDLNIYHGDSLELNTGKIYGINKFDVILGNPPYNKELKRTGATAFYNEFIEKFIDKCKYQTFIIPSRWFSGGKGLDKFRKNMLQRKDIVYINHYDDASKIFGNMVDIKGGVNYYLKDSDYSGKCNYNGNKIELNSFDILVDSKYYDLVNKIIKYPNISDIYIGRYFGIESNDKRLSDKDGGNKLKCYVSKQKGFIKYIDKDVVKKDYKFWKVITAEASYKGKSGFGNILVGSENDVHTGSYISFQVSSKIETESLMSYLNCKLPNFMLSLRKISQHVNNNTCKWIPLPSLDRVWTNKKIYNYYELTKKDIKLITETKIIGYSD
jgi:hypothetical protein